MKDKLTNTWFIGGIIILFSVLNLFVCILFSHGEIVGQYFFYDNRDTGMDFFNSIASVKNATPYSYASTIYPPLANLLFYLVYLCVPLSYSSQWRQSIGGFVSSRGTALDLRTYQSTMLAFILFLVFSSLLVFWLSKKILGYQKYSSLIAFCSVFSYGFLQGIERGNIILLSLSFLLMFFLFYNSENKYLKEISCVCLAVSAGLKIYPAIFGLLMIYDKDYKRAFRTVIYGLFFLFVPFFFFEGSSVIGSFVHTIFKIGEGATGYSDISLGGNGFEGVFRSVVYLISVCFHGDFSQWYSNSSWLFVILRFFLLACLVWFGFFAKDIWEKILALTLIVFLFLEPGGYSLVFVIPLFLFFLMKNRNILELTIGEKFVFTSLLLWLAPFPVFGGIGPEGNQLSVRELINQICILTLFCYTMVKFVRIIMLHWKKRLVKVSVITVGIVVLVISVKFVIPVNTTLEEYTVPEQCVTDLERVDYSIESAEDTDHVLKLSGWFVVKGDSQHYNTYCPKQLLLLDQETKKYYVFPTGLNMRQDITDMINDGTNYDYAGFSGSLSTDLLTPGHTYQLCILYSAKSENYLISTEYQWKI